MKFGGPSTSGIRCLGCRKQCFSILDHSSGNLWFHAFFNKLLLSTSWQ
jgi:hypothetical protein